jgi:hypothetical protein
MLINSAAGISRTVIDGAYDYLLVRTRQLGGPDDLHPQGLIAICCLCWRMNHVRRDRHFGLQLGLDLASMFIGQRAVRAGIGMDFRAVQSHPAQPEQAHLARQLQHPHEQRFDVLEKATPKRCDGVVVGMIVRGDEAERYRIVGRPPSLRLENTPVV